MFWVDITDASENKLGPGPLTTGIKWRYTQRLSRAGEWSLEVPANDPRLDFATLKRNLNCYALLGPTKTWMGGGALEKKVMSLRGTSTPTMVLSGNDVLYELARNTVNLKLDFNSGFLGNAMYGQIMAGAPSGWGYLVSGTTPDLTARFVDESILNALTTITNKTGQMFRFRQSGFTPLSKQVYIFSATESTGILATNMADPIAIERNRNACMIVDIDRQEDAFSLVNKAIPYGAGTGQARLTIYAATQWPDGTVSNHPYTTTDRMGHTHTFTCDQTYNWVSDVESRTAYGLYEGQIQYKEIGPVTNEPNDISAAANVLLAATVQYLLDSSIPQEHYTLNVAGLRSPVYPGQKIHVVARQTRDGKTPININQDLIIQEVVTEIDAAGVRTVSLTVATTREFAKSDAQVLVNEIQKSLAYQAHPQTGPNSFTVSYREDIDDDYGGTFPFWLSRDTTTINSVILRFRLDRLRSTVKSVGGEVHPTTPPQLPPHTHPVDVGTHTHDLPDHQHPIQISDGSLAPAVLHVFGSGGTDAGFETSGFGTTVYAYTDNLRAAATSPASTDAVSTSENSATDIDITIDLSNAISAVYGIFEDPTAPHEVGDLRWTVNAVGVSGNPTAIVGGWFEFDITNLVINPLNSRPITQANTVEVAVAFPETTAALQKRVRVTAQIEIRNIIQSIAVV